MHRTSPHRGTLALALTLSVVPAFANIATVAALDPPAELQAAELQAAEKCTDFGGPFGWQGARVRSTAPACSYLLDADLTAIALDGTGVVEVLDGSRGVIDRLASDGARLASIPALGTRSAVQIGGGPPIDVPPVDGVAVAMALDGKGGTYVSICCPTPAIEHLDANGTLLAVFGTLELTRPAGAIAVTPDGHVLAVTRDARSGYRIQVFDADGSPVGRLGD